MAEYGLYKLKYVEQSEYQSTPAKADHGVWSEQLVDHGQTMVKALL